MLAGYSNTRTNAQDRRSPGTVRTDPCRPADPAARRAETARRRSNLPSCRVLPQDGLRARTLRRVEAMALDKRRLGTTDFEITTVGLGAWALGGGGWAYGWGPQD